mgnify:CR=1 FL=1
MASHAVREAHRAVTYTVRTCSRCGTKEVTKACPTCTKEWETRRDVATMSVEERKTEFDSWGPILEIDFSKFHERMEELVGRPIWTHEFATPNRLRAQIGLVDGGSYKDAANLAMNDPILDGIPVITVVVDDDRTEAAR